MFLFSCKQQHEKGELTMESKIKTNLNAFLDSCWNKGDTNQIDKISTENFTRFLNGIKVASSQKEMQAHMSVYFTAFPDLEVLYDSISIKDNKVFMKWTSTGTNTGRFGEFPATGKKVKIKGLSHLFFNKTGMLYKEDVYYNELDLLQQLGYTLKPPIVE